MHNSSNIIDSVVCHKKMTMFADSKPSLEYEGFMAPHTAVRIGFSFKDGLQDVQVHELIKTKCTYKAHEATLAVSVE